MADQTSRLDELRSEAEAAVAAAAEPAALEELRVRYLGRKSELTGVLRGIRDLPPEDRGPVGQAANRVRQALEQILADRQKALEDSELERTLSQDRIDVTLPGDPPLPPGYLHLVTQTRRDMEDIFLGMGFNVVEGPEIEFDYYNFTALNIPPDHPARAMQDTFYFSDDVVLRTHTSPNQVRAMEVQEPPIYIVVPGKTYRRDNDASHTPMFHQMEGLAVDEGITLGDLLGTVEAFIHALFGDKINARFLPSFFPFTEPSVEVDISCFRCGGSGTLPEGGRDPLCKGTGWIEILGSGMVDPNVYSFVADNGYDPDRVQGFAFGMGIDRIALLRHGVHDLRALFDNDLRFLEQFR
jgi:phenylalanyl-tRNA synthetase alpha chain